MPIQIESMKCLVTYIHLDADFRVSLLSEVKGIFVNPENVPNTRAKANKGRLIVVLKREVIRLHPNSM